MTSSIDRRRFLVAGALGATALAGCSSTDEDISTSTTSTTPDNELGGGASTTTATTDGADSTESAAGATDASTELTAADFAALGSCLLLPEKTAGPYPLDQQFDRRDITEGLPGRPLRLGLRVLDEACAAVAGAKVEIWHCDATGDYSAFTDNGGGKDEGEGTTFLRGTQTANDEGIVEFATVYPGWYSGRAVHIHLRVHLEDKIVLTSQLFFDADYTEQVYADEPYSDNGLPDTSNERDSIAGDVEREGTLVHTTDATATGGVAATLGLLNLAIDPSARSTGGPMGGGPGGGGPMGAGPSGGGPGGRP
ncbi:MAG TPA: intradiol ring-cleavage dioxygenase [Microthrixaceae bacterium]|nr:intradiol ring-cleavage dioxygenase [Microthrixaceae bacterium]HNI35142.1 intradiol ring-cleavage dioxygenase [Microthrixaceae bacterium]